jgi:hypothetical protein
MLVPNMRIVALMMPRVMELADGTVLNIVDAIEYVQQAQKEKRESIKLLDLLKVLQECAIALARVCFYRTRFQFLHMPEIPAPISEGLDLRQKSLHPATSLFRRIPCFCPTLS